MQTSAAGIALIKRFEGFSPVAYDDGRGVRTIGYGTTEADIRPLPTHITEARASALLVERLRTKYEPAVRALFEPGGPLHGLFNRNRFDAFTSIVYNLGTGAVPFKTRDGRWARYNEFATLGKAILSRDLAGIARAMLLYSNPGNPEVHAGLLRRRQAEAALFLRPLPRFAEFTGEERDLVLAFDALKGHTSFAARAKRAELQRRMRRRLEAIRKAAQDAHGWDYHRRRERANAMKERLQ